MPTYEYKCDACGHLFEKFQSITAPAIKRCPKCGKAKVRRLISTGAGLIFKGSGFYITDYRDKAYTDQAKSESGGGDSKDSKDSKTETKTESKGETKSETKPATETPAKKSESKPASKSESKPKKK